MTTVEVVLQLPDDLARRAKEAGLLRADRIAEMIEREVALEVALEAALEAAFEETGESSVAPALRPENRRLLALLDKWAREPIEQDEIWWDNLAADLAANRFTLNTPST